MNDPGVLLPGVSDPPGNSRHSTPPPASLLPQLTGLFPNFRMCRSGLFIISEADNSSSVGWRPWAIKTPVLVFSILLCVLFPVAIEILLRISNKHGALVYAEPDTELSFRAVCLLNYFPTALTVLFGLLWGISNHHFKRLEPYYQMSKLGGALADDSILLDYSYSNGLTVPFAALKRG